MEKSDSFVLQELRCKEQVQARGFILDSRFWGYSKAEVFELQGAGVKASTSCKVQVDFMLQELRCKEQGFNMQGARLEDLELKVDGERWKLQALSVKKVHESRCKQKE
eukprot:scaffold1131_cov87-Skeletonema_menzelii.AAC.7